MGKEILVPIVVREMYGFDLSQDFLDTLSSLARVNLTLDQAKVVFRERLRKGIRTFVASLDNRIVGTASLFVEEKFIHEGGKSGHIEDVAVHRDFQKHGVGAALVRHLIEQARAAKCYKVILNCSEGTAAFYEKLGFRRHDIGMRLDL
jgi:glucosamine-phosphate N-acetyltransferase